MPRRRFIDKKSATTFQLVHRAQNDPLIHDAEASSMVFKELAPPQTHKKIKQRGDLEEEFGLSVRPNEGEAANYGIYYDDSEYDYMQHLRDLGTSTEGHFVEAPQPSSKGKGKGKQQRLEDALAQVSLDDGLRSEGGISIASNASSLLDPDVLPSEFVRKTTYQDQQDVPDAIAGFQPDMDPRLREVLEALEDEEYVDDEEDVFAELTKGGEVVDQYEWEEEAELGELDEGWETDDTIKAGDGGKSRTAVSAPVSEPDPSSVPLEDGPDHGDGDWMAEFSKFKRDSKATKVQRAVPAPSDLQSSILSGATSLVGGKKKKRKGAMTSTSGYSMSSSALFRTEEQTTLDARFEKIEEEYADDGYGDDDGVSLASSRASFSTTGSQAPQLVRSDFDSIMDDFLGGHSMSGKRRVKKGGYQTGLQQLDEIRKGLGPARIKPQKV